MLAKGAQCWQKGRNKGRNKNIAPHAQTIGIIDYYYKRGAMFKNIGYFMYESIYIYTHTYIDFTHIYKCSSNDFCALCALCALCSFFDLFLEKKLNKINYLKKGRKEGAQ